MLSLFNEAHDFITAVRHAIFFVSFVIATELLFLSFRDSYSFRTLSGVEAYVRVTCGVKSKNKLYSGGSGLRRPTCCHRNNGHNGQHSTFNRHASSHAILLNPHRHPTLPATARPPTADYWSNRRRPIGVSCALFAICHCN